MIPSLVASELRESVLEFLTEDLGPGGAGCDHPRHPAAPEHRSRELQNDLVAADDNSWR